jgi:O-methyltransferase
VSDLYLDLMERVLTREAFVDQELREISPTGWKRWLVDRVKAKGYRVVAPVDPVLREAGRDWPATAETMIGPARLRNIRMCVEAVLADDVPGDLLEAGVWHGGAAIFMRAILAAHDVTDRSVWLADSFRGLPPPTLPQDEGLDHTIYPELSVSVDEVRHNFERYGLLDDQVRFLEGWFADTLPGPVTRLAVLRLDGDLYESTWDAITVLEPLVTPGGFVIVDDYGAISACAQAVHDYRDKVAITDPIIEIDWTGVYWRKGF